MKRDASRLRTVAWISLAWIGAVALFVTLNARAQIDRASEELNATGFMLHRIISQRVAQHDAHLTSLIALVLVADPPPQDAIRQVAQNIIRFYPRVAAVNLVSLAQDGTVVTMTPVLAVPQANEAAAPAPFAGSIFQQRPGQVRAYIDPKLPERYLLGKKASATNPAFAIIMEIDPALLVEPDERPAWAHLMLSLDGHVLTDRASDEIASAWISVPRFSRTIDNPSQPLLLTLERPIALEDIINPRMTLGFAALSLIALLILHYAWKQRVAAGRSQAAAQVAEQKTQLLEHETRLAHASRVNALGELASGIAHELTQPLTALLSQSQAARRLASNDDNQALLLQALDANVREAKRAGQMLARMRDYISNREPQRVLTDINQVVMDVCELARADLTARGISLAPDLQPALPQAVVDPIEMEQVLLNLIRNAADSLDETAVPEKRIGVRTTSSDGQLMVRVEDNGHGIPPDVAPRLFEPFFTTKASGMGLGLPLCATLVERVGGSIVAGEATSGGACFTITLPASKSIQMAAQ